jgi:hypothetical protein
MGWLTAIILLLISVGLFVAVRKKIISNKTLEILANIAAIVAFLAAAAVFIIPPAIPGSKDQTPTITPVVSNGIIQFGAQGNPKRLSEKFTWDAGSAQESKYAISADRIEITAGPYSWPFFPTVSYLYPVRGDFDVQVEIGFDPSVTKLENAQHMAGILVKPTGDRLVQGNESFPDTWIANTRSVSDQGQSIGCRGNFSDYGSNLAYLRVQRKGNSIRCAYSSNNENWIWISPKTSTASFTENTEFDLVLFVFSTNLSPADVNFSNFSLMSN